MMWMAAISILYDSFLAPLDFSDGKVIYIEWRFTAMMDINGVSYKVLSSIRSKYIYIYIYIYMHRWYKQIVQVLYDNTSIYVSTWVWKYSCKMWITIYICIYEWAYWTYYCTSVYSKGILQTKVPIAESLTWLYLLAIRQTSVPP